MRLVLLGPPGAGKGTQAQVLARRYQLPAISTGELFRATASKHTQLGRVIRGHMAAGRLVPDEVTNAMVECRLAQPDVSVGFLLDGFPRTLEQAYQLDRVLWRSNVTLDAAVSLRMDVDAVVRRLSGRRSCPACGAVWHLEFRPTRRSDRCDDCGDELYQREDDTEVAIRARLTAHRVNSAPLLAFYAVSDRLVEVDASGAVDDVTAATVAALDRVRADEPGDVPALRSASARRAVLSG